jgi:dihydrofolate synthase/folylpolyglutamate synthase
MEETALAAFHRLPAYDRLKSSELRDEMFDLARFKRFLDRAGNPEKGLPVIHVTGSKGKGSTSALIAGGLMALGKRIGVFMSPYLFHPTESIFVQGRPLNKAVFDRMMKGYYPLLESLSAKDQITSFELLTTMALQHFHDEDVDFAIMETGLGGLKDATNVVESPVVSVICPIEKEHTQILGNSITSIAFEKLGIVREDTPVVVARQSDFVTDFARTQCLQKKAPCIITKTKYKASVLDRTTQGFSFRLETPTREIPRIHLSLLGDHQVENAATAWAVLDQLLPGFDPQPVIDVWKNMTLSGRFEFTSRGQQELILDGAHTPESAKALRKTLDQLYGGEPITFILAFMEDKDVEGFIKSLVRWGDTVVLTQMDHPRIMPARMIEQRIREIWPEDRLTTALTNNVRIAWQKAQKLAGRGPICATGSFKLVEEL